jgi:hypothetical protein
VCLRKQPEVVLDKMIKNIDIPKLKEYIHNMNARYIKSAEEYQRVCVQYGQSYSEFQKILAGRGMTYRETKKNLGVEFAILMALADTNFEKRVEFEKLNTDVNILDGKKRGLACLLEALKSEAMSVASLLKYEADGSRFGG